jgi:hypothetical protein
MRELVPQSLQLQFEVTLVRDVDYHAAHEYRLADRAQLHSFSGI